MDDLRVASPPALHPEAPAGEDAVHGESMVVNMGPSHPSTHGVLRLVVALDGEVVKSVQPHVGYLHRGMEKIAEGMTYNQFVPYTDRLDYLAPLSNNVAYILAVEKLLGITVPPRAQVIRVICCEIARISAHLLWLGTGALDLGAATVFFHTFRERETLYNIIETFPAMLDEIDSLLTRNRIWMKRTQGVGRIGAAEAIALGLTGPNLRGCGIAYDVRRTEPYSGYEAYEFEVPVGSEGDAYDRYLVRLEEMRQSTRILDQALRRLPEGRIAVDDPKITLPDKERVLIRMEELI